MAQNPDKRLGRNLRPKSFQPPAKPSVEDKPTKSTTRRRSVLANENGKWWQSQFNLMLLAFASVGVAALLFIFLSSAPSVSSINTTQTSEADASLESATTSESTTDSPFRDAQRASNREVSQDVLADLLALKRQLEAKDVNQWAESSFSSALAAAERGDELYSDKDFDGAAAQYDSALVQMQAIQESLPDRVAQISALGNQAISEGKTELAVEYFEQALQLNQNHIPALEGLERSKSLDEVINFVNIAKNEVQKFEQTDQKNHIDLAKSNLEQALALDVKYTAANDLLKAVGELGQDKNFRDAMSLGFQNMLSGRYRNASRAFADALSIKPEDETAKNAYRQMLASNTRASLSSLIASAKTLERQEKWAAALSSYEEILSRDPNQVSAKVGKARASARKGLDTDIKSILADTLELGKQTRRDEAQKLLASAKQLSQKGGRLSSQINALEQALAGTTKEIRVVIVSDNATSVTLKKDGANRIDLGRFQERRLALKPGRYTLRGQRLGFKDTLLRVDVSTGQSQTKELRVICDETVIGATAVSGN